MKDVPNIISTKDLSYIKDMIKWNLIISKKSRMYKDINENIDVKKFLDKISKTHTIHYKKLMEILE